MTAQRAIPSHPIPSNPIPHLHNLIRLPQSASKIWAYSRRAEARVDLASWGPGSEGGVDLYMQCQYVHIVGLQ